VINTDWSGRQSLPQSADPTDEWGPGSAGPAAKPSVWRRLRGRTGWLALAVATLLAVSAAFSIHAVDADSGYDLLTLLRVIGHDMAHLRWQFTALVVVLAGAHYLATAVAARAASGLLLPYGEALLVQFAAAAANRLSAAGVGGSAVNARYFVRRGLPGPSAVGAVVALSVFGAVSDLLVLLLLILIGQQIGLTGVPSELTVLSSRISGPTSVLLSWWGLAAAVLVLVVVLAAVRRFRDRLVRARRRFWGPIWLLLRQPPRLLTLLAASGSTTLILAFAFVLTVRMVPGGVGTAGSGALLIGFMLGSAAGNAVPVPAGAGSTETALVTVLIAGGEATTRAVEVVLVYRIITFWLPALLGIPAARRLRRGHAL
jgi:uncharacterized membrane protein YbhN (UPF0104 family)